MTHFHLTNLRIVRSLSKLEFKIENNQDNQEVNEICLTTLDYIHYVQNKDFPFNNSFVSTFQLDIQ